ncbi:SOS-response transcriptional repressor LexA [Variovorax sp. TBS-050B]|uniref:helix-turn-helix domain-containing protein n=1 Tax=Variovorax sp. TBS-050B TaxID=2940551 RepID=UPI0024771C9B|nr:XRE family transcriptional regulator [Variovorax sp. TBS-050B]MDH6594477.1 SOS-response transcriptional repressor LexA [Variovorax sp. TBS-050B]
METIAARAKAARKFAKMTQKQAEAASGVKQSNISKIERGDTGRSMGLLALARAYRVDPNWLDTGDGPAPWDEVQSRPSRDNANEPPPPYRVARTPPAGPAFEPGTPDTLPLIGWSEVASWTSASRDSTKAERWIPCIAHHSRDRSYALRVRGDSMTAPSGHLKSYPAGSIIFVDTQLTTPADGERVIARLETGEITFKTYKEEDGRRWLLPLNPKHEPIRTPFTVLGTVVGKWEDED